MTSWLETAARGARSGAAAIARAARRLRLRRPAALAAAAAAGMACFASSGQVLERSPSERSVKAAYLLKFPAYVEWPAEHFASADAPLTIGVLDAAEVADELAAIAEGRTSGGRPLRVRRFGRGEAIGGVDVLFAPDGGGARREEVAAVAAMQSILTVTDAQGAARSGVIDFTIVDGRVRFAVNLAVAERNGVRPHSGLLTVAERVYGARR